MEEAEERGGGGGGGGCESDNHRERERERERERTKGVKAKRKGRGASRALAPSNLSVSLSGLSCYRISLRIIILSREVKLQFEGGLRSRSRARSTTTKYSRFSLARSLALLERGFSFFHISALVSPSLYALQILDYRDDVAVADVGDGLRGAEHAEGRRPRRQRGTSIGRRRR